jgi:hypothetical protein
MPLLIPSVFRSVRLAVRSKPFRPVTHLDPAVCAFRRYRPLLESLSQSQKTAGMSGDVTVGMITYLWFYQACLASNPFMARLPVENGHPFPSPS